MQENHRSLTKLIIFLIALCLIVMGSVFFYHYRHQENPIRLANDRALVFTSGRDIKPFSLVSTDNKKFSERDLVKHWTLLFFGFTHCTSICPTTMTMLKDAYPRLHQQFPNLQVVLVSLDPARDNGSITSQYAKRFHPDFYGVSGNLTEIRKFQGQLGIASARDDEGSTTGNYQIIHTPSIMLISPEVKWVAMFKNGMGDKEFIQVFTDSMKTFK